LNKRGINSEIAFFDVESLNARNFPAFQYNYVHTTGQHYITHTLQ
jgi:hypothetical protein